MDSKRTLIERLAADIVVVPECSSAPTFATELGVSFAWRGEIATKGLGVVGLNGWQVVPAAEGTEMPWVLPLRVLDPRGRDVALLLAIWTVARPARPSYAGQVAAAIGEWADEIRDGSTILAGDFNCSAQTADPRRHLANLRELEMLGAVSAYHHWNRIAPGEETAMTLQWTGPNAAPGGYHCDFVFTSAALTPLIRNVEVGTFADWIETKNSDHCPVIVDFDGADFHQLGE